MSAEATGWVWRHSGYTGTTFVVQLAIADIVNDVHRNEFWMAIPHLAEKARIGRASAFKAVAELVNDGHLEVLERFPGERRPSRFLWKTAGRVRQVDSVGQSVDSSSPAGGLRTKEGTQETSSRPNLGLVAGDKECARCQGRGHYFHAGSGQDVKCQCSREATA